MRDIEEANKGKNLLLEAIVSPASQNNKQVIFSEEEDKDNNDQ